MSGSTAHDEAARIASIPVLRTFESRRFRLIVATSLALLGVAVNLMRLTMFDSGEGWAFDFAAYYHAAERMLAGTSPYTAAQLASPVVEYCFDCYKYPPFVAQILTPLTLMQLEAAKVIWLAIGYAAAFASTWLATGIGGANKSLERAIWCLAAVTLFEPVSSAVWNGNVGTIVALGVTMVAMGGVAAGVGAGVVTLLKVVPVTLLPAVLASSRETRTSPGGHARRRRRVPVPPCATSVARVPGGPREPGRRFGAVRWEPGSWVCRVRGRLGARCCVRRAPGDRWWRRVRASWPASGSRGSAVACLRRRCSAPWRC